MSYDGRCNINIISFIFLIRMIMKKSKLFTLILAIVAMMWIGNLWAQDGLVLGMTFVQTNYTGPVTGDGIFGSVYYDAATKTLTLDDAQLENTEDCAFVNEVIDGITILVKGNCSITETNTNYGAFKTSCNTTIKGDGTLIVKGKGGAVKVKNESRQTKFIIEDCTLYAIGDEQGLCGNTNCSLIIRNATIHASGPIKGSVKEWAEILLEGCSITVPSGASVASTPYGVGQSIVYNGEIVTSEVMITPIPNSISQPVSTGSETIREIYSVDGRRQQHMQQGLNIVKMNDGTTKKIIVVR